MPDSADPISVPSTCRPLQAVLFDLDGTLAESLSALGSAYQSFLNRFGHVGNHAEFERLNGPSLPEIVRALKKSYGLEPTVEELLTIYKAEISEAYVRDVTLAPFARECLEAVRRHVPTVGLVTSNLASIVKPFLERNQITFDLVLCGDDAKRSKPSPDLYVEALHKGSLEPDSTLVLEDSQKGVAAAQGAGLPTVQIATDDAPVAAEADFTISSLLELPEFVRILCQIPSCDCDVVHTGPVETRWDEVSPERWDKETQLRIDSVWEREVAKSGNRLHDGRMLSFKNVSEATVWGEVVSYRAFLAQLREADLELNIRPLGVAGIVTTPDSGGAVLLGQRASWVTQYPGFWETVPSGGIDSSALRSDGIVETVAMLLQEFEEETGGVASLVETVEPLGLVYDALYGVYDLFYRLVVKSPLEELTGCVSQRGEYRRLACVTVPELKAWLSDFRKPFVPPVRTMLSQLLACMDAL